MIDYLIAVLVHIPFAIINILSLFIAYHLGCKDTRKEYNRKITQARNKIDNFDVNEVMGGCSEPFRRGVAKGLDISVVMLDKTIGESNNEVN